jgi:hypothetical protein
VVGLALKLLVTDVGLALEHIDEPSEG